MLCLSAFVAADASQHFALSLGRHGVDFRPLLTPVFERASVRLFTTRIAAASKGFAADLTSVTLTAHVAIPDSESACETVLNDHSHFVPDCSFFIRYCLLVAYVELLLYCNIFLFPEPVVLASCSHAVAATSTSVLVPLSLMSHPILAVLANAYLVAFNDLRECAPLAVADTIALALRDQLSGIVVALVAYHKRSHPSFDQVRVHAFCPCVVAVYFNFNCDKRHFCL